MNGSARSRGALRTLTIGAVIMLAAGMLAAPAIAADSRTLYVGTNLDVDVLPVDAPDGIPDNNGVLLPTPASQGEATKVDVTVLSGDNQTLANTWLYFPKQGTSLPTGLTIANVHGADAGACDWTSGGTTVVCGFGNLAGFDRRDISIVVSVPSDFPTAAANLFSVNVQTNNENGDNLQDFGAASGTYTITAYSPDSLASFVPPGQTKQFATGGVGGGNRLQTTVAFTSQDSGNLVQISESKTGAPACPAGLECQPDYTTVNIDGGTATFTASPYLTWKLNALVPGTFNVNKAFVAHYPTGSSTADWILYWKNRGDRCGSDTGAAIAASPVGACLKSVTVGRADKTTGLAPLEIVFVTDHNGQARY